MSASPPADAWPVVGLVLLGVVIRFSTLSLQSLWADEGFTAKIAGASLSDAASQIPHTESTPPLYYTLAWIWAHLFGPSAFALRSLPATFGCMTIAAMYWTARALSTRRVALIAALFTALSPFMVWYSQEARAYALFVLLSVLALGFFARALSDARRAWLVGWSVCSAAALAKHYFALFPFAVQGGWLMFRRPDRRRLLLAALLPVFTLAGLAPLALYQQRHVPRPWTSVYTVADQVKSSAQSFLVGINRTPIIHRFGVGVIGVCVIAALAALLWRSTEGERQVGLSLALFVILALVIPTVVSMLGTNDLAPRNLLYAWPFLALIVALGAGRRDAGVVSAIVLATSCIVSFLIVGATSTTPVLQRDNWRALLKPLGRPEVPHALMVVDGFNDEPIVQYYLRNARRLTRPFGVREIDVLTDARSEALNPAPFLPPGQLRFVSRQIQGRIGLVRFSTSRLMVVAPPGSAAAGEVVLVQPGRVLANRYVVLGERDTPVDCRRGDPEISVVMPLMQSVADPAALVAELRDAALRGSSHLKLPRVLAFFSGNIGLHHVHHLNARIPHYHLPQAHASIPHFDSVPTLTLWQGLRTVRLKLWDERSNRLVTFAQARRSVRAAVASPPIEATRAVPARGVA